MLNPITIWSVALNVALYPSTWLHEQTHYVVYRPYTSAATRSYSPTDTRASLSVDVEEMPTWRYILGAIAPTLVGLFLAVFAVVVSFTTAYGAMHGDLLLWLVIGVYWFTYTIPSAADVQTAAGAVDGGRA